MNGSLRFNFSGKNFEGVFWTPAHGQIGATLAIDCETDKIEPGKTPKFILAQAYSGGSTVYFLSTKQVGPFMGIHQQCTMIMHNAPFDIDVISHETGFDFDVMIRNNRVFDTELLHRLWLLATKGVTFPISLQNLASLILKIDIEKINSIRHSFGQFVVNGSILYQEISDEHLKYAAIDSIVTLQIFEELRVRIARLEPRNFLSHKVQLMGAIGLYSVSKLGIGFDCDQKNRFLDSLKPVENEAKNLLREYGFFPKGVSAEGAGSPGMRPKNIMKTYSEIIDRIGVNLPRTPSGLLSTRIEDLTIFRDRHPFIDAYLNYKETLNLRTKIEQLTDSRIHSRFNVLLRTGRTSSSAPNIQNLPRRPGIREAFVPAPGFAFLVLDYSQIELRTLAQICLDRYGHSQMAVLINEGVDLHARFASMITGKPECEVTKVDRQRAKACNFGFPGGLGIARFVAYAKHSYGLVDMSEELAGALKKEWLALFPEMQLYLQDVISSRYDFGSSPWTSDPSIAAAVFKRVVGGEPFSRVSGKRYGKKILDWALQEVLPAVAPHLAGSTIGSPELLAAIQREKVTSRTGRVRANTSYCEAKNSPFQGLAADGCKIALYRLIRANYRVVNFIHDEFIIEVPMYEALEDVAYRAKEIMVEAMKTVVPDVTIEADWYVSDRWYKAAKLVRDENGDVRPFTQTDLACT